MVRALIGAPKQDGNVDAGASPARLSGIVTADRPRLQLAAASLYANLAKAVVVGRAVGGVGEEVLAAQLALDLVVDRLQFLHPLDEEGPAAGLRGQGLEMPAGLAQLEGAAHPQAHGVDRDAAAAR